MNPPKVITPESVRHYLSKIDDLENGDAKVSATELAVRYADELNDDILRYDSRSQLVSAAIFSGRPDIAIVNFSWMLSHFDAQPDGIDDWLLLWKYKWIVGNVAGFPQIPKDRILAMLADLESRYERYGCGEHAIQSLRRRIYDQFGDKAQARVADRSMKKAYRDILSDCQACLRSGEVKRLSERGFFEKAIEAAEPIIRGSMKCATVPHSTFGALLLPLLRSNRGEEAMALHKRGYRLTEHNPSLINSAGEHMAFLALTGNLTVALKLFARHAPVAAVAKDPSNEFSFNQDALLTLLLLEDSGKDHLKLRLPKEFPVAGNGGTFMTQDLLKWYQTRLVDLASRYDARNGNDDRMKLVRKVPKLKRFATVIPLQKKRS